MLTLDCRYSKIENHNIAIAVCRLDMVEMRFQVN